MTRRSLTFLSIACVSLCANTPPPMTAFVHAKLLTISHGTIEDGTIMLAGSKIARVGPASMAIPSEARIVDATGLTIYPGLIDAAGVLGLEGVVSSDASNDTSGNETPPAPEVHVADAIHADTDQILVDRANGLTGVAVSPGGRGLLPGQMAFVQLDGDPEDAVVRRDVGLEINLGARGRRVNAAPTTRAGEMAMLRQLFSDAQAAKPSTTSKLGALRPYLDAVLPTVISAERDTDVEAALALAREFKLKLVLSRLTHIDKSLPAIVASRAPVIFGPIYDLPDAGQRYDRIFRLPAELDRQGVKIAFADFGQDMAGSRNLPYAAGLAVAYGLPHDEALRAITLNPAEIFGLAASLGSLDEGKTADIVIADGDPLDVKTHVMRVYIAGIEVPLENRQTRLRDLYTKGRNR